MPRIWQAHPASSHSAPAWHGSALPRLLRQRAPCEEHLNRHTPLDAPHTTASHGLQCDGMDVLAVRQAFAYAKEYAVSSGAPLRVSSACTFCAPQPARQPASSSCPLPLPNQRACRAQRGCGPGARLTLPGPAVSTPARARSVAPAAHLLNPPPPHSRPAHDRPTSVPRRPFPRRPHCARDGHVSLPRPLHVRPRLHLPVRAHPCAHPRASACLPDPVRRARSSHARRGARAPPPAAAGALPGSQCCPGGMHAGAARNAALASAPAR